MITNYEVLETMHMFNEEHLDIRTITMGISLMWNPVGVYTTRS